MQQQRCCIPSIGSGGGCNNNNNNSNSGGGGCIVGVNNMGNCYYATTAPTMKTAANLLPFSSSASNGPLTPPPPLQQQQQQQPAISPTFIEHKYSANTFKEKFLANIRQNQQNVTNKLKSLHSSSSPMAAIMMDTPNSRTITDNDGSINNCETSNVIIKNSLETDVIDDDVDDDDHDDNNNNNDDDDGTEGTNVGGNGEVSGVASIFATDNDVNNGNHPEKCSIQQQLNETIKNNLYKKSIN